MSKENLFKPSWKDKIDPAFDKLIKFYIQFVELIGLPANKGWLVLQDDALRLWQKKGMQGWIKAYEKNMTSEKNTIIRLKIPKNVTEEERNKTRRYIEKKLLADIKILPEDSQAYYKKTFEPFYAENVSQDYFKNRSVEQVKRIYTDFITDQFLLHLHIALIEMENERKNKPEEVLIKKYFRHSTIFFLLTGIYNLNHPGYSGDRFV